MGQSAAVWQGCVQKEPPLPEKSWQSPEAQSEPCVHDAPNGAPPPEPPASIAPPELLPELLPEPLPELLPEPLPELLPDPEPLLLPLAPEEPLLLVLPPDDEELVDPPLEPPLDPELDPEPEDAAPPPEPDEDVLP